MLSDDYLIRMIKQAAEVMLRITGLKKAGQYPEALEVIDHALEQLFGIDSDLIRLMDDESLSGMLVKSEPEDVERLEFAAELYKEEGDILQLRNQTPESRACHLRSLNYYLMASTGSAPAHSAELSPKIEELIQILDDSDLPKKTLFHLFCFLENEGKYLRAEKVLLQLAGYPASESEARSELALFYQRLREKSPEDLAAGGMNKLNLPRNHDQ